MGNFLRSNRRKNFLNSQYNKVPLLDGEYEESVIFNTEFEKNRNNQKYNILDRIDNVENELNYQVRNINTTTHHLKKRNNTIQNKLEKSESICNIIDTLFQNEANTNKTMIVNHFKLVYTYIRYLMDENKTTWEEVVKENIYENEYESCLLESDISNNNILFSISNMNNSSTNNSSRVSLI